MKKIVLIVAKVIVILVTFIFAYMGYFFITSGLISKGEPIVSSITDQPALLVIDIQEGITGELASSFTKSYAQQSEPFIQIVNQVIEKAKIQNIPVIYIRQETKDVIINLLTGGKMLASGSEATALDSRIIIVPGPVFMKQKGDSFSNPQLEAYLHDNKINHLYMIGLDATQCVHKTIKGALLRGYHVTAISDALIASKKEKKEKVLEQYKKEGVVVISADQW